MATLGSLKAYEASRSDAGFWWPYVAEVLALHGLTDARQDRHVELIQIYRDVFRCEKAPFQMFLGAADWPVGNDFPLKALGFALHRQALGLAQHPNIDVFMPIAERYPLQDIGTLDELASVLFAM